MTKIWKDGNYIFIQIDSNPTREFLARDFQVKKESDGEYSFLNNNNNVIESNVPIADIKDQSGSSYADFDQWRVDNTGSGASSTSDAALASIDSKLPSLDNSKTPVIPSMTSGGNISVQTAAVGTNYTAFGNQACKQLNVSNQSGVTIEVQQGGAGVGLQIPTGSFYTFFGITNANQLSVRRVDISNTVVTITARWEA